MNYKECLKDGCGNPRFGKGYCKFHQYLRTDKKPKTQKRSRIKPISDKRKAENEEYKIIRLKYLLKHKLCEFEGCKKHSTEIHHKNDRNGQRLNESEHFMAICREHHMWIHANPKQAREKGYLI